MITGAVLAGGASRRFPCGKAGLEFGNASLIETVCRKVRAVCSELIIVSSKPIDGIPGDVRLVGDIYQGCGPLGGIHAALHHAAHSHVLTVACDMPFLRVELLRYMARKASAGYDIVVPRVGEFVEPLHAVYSRSLRDRAEELLAAGERRVRALFDGAEVYEIDATAIRRFDPDGLAFFNLNTRADLDRARQLTRTVRHGT